MLGKLLKYDIKATAMSLFPLYGVLLIVSCVLGLTNRFDVYGSVLPYMMTLYLIVIIGVAIATVIILIQRFSHNLLGNEGYMMFAVPTSTLTHILSKLLNTLLWSFISSIVVLLSIACIGLINMDFEMLEDFLYAFQYMFQFRIEAPMVIQYIVTTTLTYAIYIASFTSMLYAGIAIGHLWSEHQRLASFIAIVCFSIGMSMITNQVVYHFSNYLNLLYLSMALRFVYTLIYCAIAWVILDKKLNLQ